MRALYVSHNGMLENLGQAQVLPYVRGLSRRGIRFEILSYEREEASCEAIAELTESLRADGIEWTPLRRARDPRLRTKLAESTRGVTRALVSALRRRPRIIHGRSYLPTAVGDLVATMVPGARLLFDCRGMIGDEYVDAGYWTSERFEYRLVKRYEARMFRRAEGVVVLTETLKRIVEERGWLGRHTAIAAIPCCVDLDRFRFDPVERARVRRELGLEAHVVLGYSGSLGGWYREPELARFAGLVRQRAGRPVAFLVLTPSPAEELSSALEREGFSKSEIAVMRVAPAKMRSYLSAADLGLSFIKSCFSKLGSSPTKVAEYLACGLPVVVNGDIGDQSDLAVERDACVVMPSLSDADLDAAAGRALALATAPLEERVAAARRVARERFGLETVGVARYARLYETIGGA